MTYCHELLIERNPATPKHNTRQLTYKELVWYIIPDVCLDDSFEFCWHIYSVCSSFLLLILKLRLWAVLSGLAQLVPLSYMEHEYNILPCIILQYQHIFGQLNKPCDIKPVWMNHLRNVTVFIVKTQSWSTLSPPQDIFTSLTSHLCNLMELLSYCQLILHPIFHGAHWDLSPDLHLPLKPGTPAPSPISKLFPHCSFIANAACFLSFCCSSRFQPPVGVTEHFKENFIKLPSAQHFKEKKPRKWSFYNDYLTPHPSLRSQQTEEPPGVHQSLQGEAARLPAEGGSAPATGLHLCWCDWWVPISRSLLLTLELKMSSSGCYMGSYRRWIPWRGMQGYDLARSTISHARTLMKTAIVDMLWKPNTSIIQ